MSAKRKRCAIYTRKSTEEGLDQEFNSLDAQREACEAFIRSQKHQGWVLGRERYDDGGISGATMERPALTRLLAEVCAGRVDVIVVYKVDRLTRALSDFAKMVELFDEHGVSFVSVTQQFNTTTSMGRLTLNVLLSFAQFEREVTAERIRDKIAASKRKGMWMGGVVPLGYDAIEKQLVISTEEARTVRALFDLYLACGNVRGAQAEALRRVLRTKRRTLRSGVQRGGGPFTRGHIYKLLTNPLYVGEILHKGKRYAGHHEAIIDRDTWERVQRQLAGNRVARRNGSNAKTPSLLAGLLFDENGARMAPSHASKGGRRYRYYVSQPCGPGDGKEPVWRLPAKEIEGLVVAKTQALLRDQRRLLDHFETARSSTGGAGELLEKAAGLSRAIGSGESAEQRAILLEFVERIEVGTERVRIYLCTAKLGDLLGVSADEERREPTGRRESSDLMLEVAVRLGRRGSELKLVIPNGRDVAAVRDPKLAATVAQAHAWFAEIRDGKHGSLRELADKVGHDRSDVGRTLRLAFLAPDIVEAIMSGRQPATLTTTRLKRLGHLPLSWAEQRQLLGFDR